MRLPIQAQPIIRILYTAKITDTGIIPSASCCYCNLLSLIPAYGTGFLIAQECLMACCTENSGAACCQSNPNVAERHDSGEKGRI